MTLRQTLIAAAAVQLAGLLAAGWWFREALNTDAVAYLRLADYYAQGSWSLALNGYWGPLLSWLLAPLRVLDCPPWLAARLVMGLSAVFFFVCCNQWLLTLPEEESWPKAGVWTAALISIPWSVAQITPDLLLAGCLALVWMALYRARQLSSPRWSLAAGALAGLAYLAKAVALPVTLLTAGLWLLGNPLQRKFFKSNAGLFAAFLVGLAIVIAPWVSLLTAHYGQLTLTRSARINHALAGPPDVERYHPTFRTFHAPPPGRLTTWEDPSEMSYATWQPWANLPSAWHQCKVILKNLALIQLMLTTLFLDWPVVLGWWWWSRRNPLTVSIPPPLRLAACALGALMLIYAPNYLRLGDQRYFYAAFPLLWLTGVWMARGFGALLPEAKRWLHHALPLSFVIPACALLFWWLPPKRAAGQIALQLAEELRATNLRGPMAGSALQPGGRVGLMTAYCLNLPWLGDQPTATPEACLASGAELFLVNQNDPLAEALQRHPAFREVSPLPSRKSPLPVVVFHGPPQPPPQGNPWAGAKHNTQAAPMPTASPRRAGHHWPTKKVLVR
ncbi:MAG: glycosyltransferase family 39 protein [Verrucomicrobiae bacterium]|nr:glycosyltransferase family 39 protein [Verrucomicrobiae bacterium]